MSFHQAWLQSNVPAMPAERFEAMLNELRARDWSDEDLERAVYPHRSR